MERHTLANFLSHLDRYISAASQSSPLLDLGNTSRISTEVYEDLMQLDPSRSLASPCRGYPKVGIYVIAQLEGGTT